MQSKKSSIILKELVHVINDCGNHWIVANIVGCIPKEVNVHQSLAQFIKKHNRLFVICLMLAKVTMKPFHKEWEDWIVLSLLLQLLLHWYLILIHLLSSLNTTKFSHLL